MTMRRFRRQRRRPAPTTDRRSPEERLEAMLRDQNIDRRERIMARIADDLDAAQDITPWLSAVSTLRDRLVVGEHEACFLAEVFVDSALVTAQDDDAELHRIGDELSAIEAADGLAPGESYATDAAPPTWTELNAAWQARADTIIAQSFRTAHLDDLATLFIERRSEFEARSEEGRARIFPPEEAED
ncbi:MAG TPA: hypothetical protein VGM82_00510 [Gemmatimonadaceae bacterium]